MIEPDNLDTVALQAANDIEDIYSQTWRGGRTQRLALIQLRIRQALVEALRHEVDRLRGDQ